jgi:hypothetical protein
MSLPSILKRVLGVVLAGFILSASFGLHLFPMITDYSSPLVAPFPVKKDPPAAMNSTMIYRSIMNLTDTDSLPVKNELVVSNYNSATAFQPGDNRCRITLENKNDYHYEIIESVAQLYPLPFNDWNCTLPAVVDVALIKQWNGPKPIDKAGYEEYFRNSLQGKLVTRPDNITIQFGELADYSNYSTAYHYHAYIDLTCDANYRPFTKLLAERPLMYCVLHGEMDKKLPGLPLPPSSQRRICYLNPTIDPESCFFIPSILPQFPLAESQSSTGRTMNLCVRGAQGHHELLAQALHELQVNISVSIVHRKIGPGEMRPYKEWNVSHLVERIEWPDFVAYQRKMADCSILVLLIDPERNPNYFRSPKKLSGQISQAIGHKIPVVAHEDLDRIYHDYWTAAVEVFVDPVTFREALKRMIQRVDQSLHQTI